MKLVGTPTILEFDAFNTETAPNSAVAGTPTHGIGETVYLGDGRIFRFGTAGAVALAQGKLMLPPADITNHQTLAVTATAIGATTVNVTLGATAASADEYDEGFMTVNVTPGQGQNYKISRNPAIGSGLAGNIVLYDPINIALTTASKVSLSHNQWANVVVSAAAAGSATQRPGGTPYIAVPIGNAAWFQTRGTLAGLNDGAVALGTNAVASASVAGAVAAQSSTYATAQTQYVVGQFSLRAGVDTAYNPYFACID